VNIISFDAEIHFYRNKFIQFGFDLYQDNPYWVPPILMDFKTLFQTSRHGFYEHGTANFLLAMDGNKPIGRLVALYNNELDLHHSNEIANFFLFEVIKDIRIAENLFEVAIEWAKNLGAKRIYGPKGMTPMDGLGLLIRGFDLRSAFGMPYNPPYYGEFIQELGFTLVRETESGHIDTKTFQIPEKVIKAAEIVKKRKGLRVLDLHSRRDLQKAVKLLAETYIAALTGTEGNLPITESDIDTMTRGLLWIAKPELIKIIMKDDKAVGFLLAYPDISAAVQKTKGKIFPFGWLSLLWEKYHTDWMNINGIGIIDEYRGMAGTALLYSELYKSVKNSQQFRHVEVIQIGVDNDRMRYELTNMGIDFYKSHGLYGLIL